MEQFVHRQNSSLSMSAGPVGSDKSLRGRSRPPMEPNLNGAAEISPAGRSSFDSDLEDKSRAAVTVQVHFRENEKINDFPAL